MILMAGGTCGGRRIGPRWEWFQWLVERMLERESLRPPVPAHLSHREWKDA